MDQSQFLKALFAAKTVTDAEAALTAFGDSHSAKLAWVPVGGNPNNRGPIEVSADAGRSLIERITNGLDAVLELAHEEKKGRPACMSPGQAATAWFGIPASGVGDLEEAERHTLAENLIVRLEEGEDRDSRTVDIIDRGIGLLPDEMADTILSINRSNKLQKFYLAGTYGQGGSSTLSYSKITLIASRRKNSNETGFTLACYHDLPADQFKSGYYAYLTLEGKLLRAAEWSSDAPFGTLVRHFGFKLHKYSGSFGPNSLYGLLHQYLFDPVLPFWLENRVHKWRRAIGGARARLNGASDDPSDKTSRTTLSHKVDFFYIDLIDFGRIGLEYWVIAPKSAEHQKPTAGFVDPDKPIILTLNGQNQCELSRLIIRKLADLSFLQFRIIVHIKCDTLKPEAKRVLFTSTREQARDSIVLRRIQAEIVTVLREDDDLTRLNALAKASSVKQDNEEQSKYIRKEVSRLLKVQGVEFANEAGSGAPSSDGIDGGKGSEGKGSGGGGSSGGGGQRPKPLPIELREPPTFVRIVWPDSDPIKFHPGRERWIRLETDAQSTYHDQLDLAQSKFNFVSSPHFVVQGTTKLVGGRFMVKLKAKSGIKPGETSKFTVNLVRTGELGSLTDSRKVEVISAPPAQTAKQKLSMPRFEFVPISAKDDANWMALGWPDDETKVASHSEYKDGILTVYYSTLFPEFAGVRKVFEHKEASLAESFELRYRIWLAVHSFLLHRSEEDEAQHSTSSAVVVGDNTKSAEEHEMAERARVARMAVMVADADVKNKKPSEDD